MIRIETKRLIIKSDASLYNGEIVFPARGAIDIFNIDTRNEKSGFAMFLKDDPSIQVGQFGFRHTHYPYELLYQTNEGFRRKHFMWEAMEAFLDWFFSNVKVDNIYGIIAEGNIPSFGLAYKLGFEDTGDFFSGSKVLSISKSKWARHNSRWDGAIL